MGTRQVTCPECSISMDSGFLADRGDHSQVAPCDWVQGPPEKSFLRGTKVRGKERHRLVVHRCPRCGLLRLYAPAEASA